MPPADPASASPVPAITTPSTTPSLKPLELSFPLPKTPHTTLHIHLTFLATSVMVFITTTSMGDSGGTVKGMGSFVYAIPDRTKPQEILTTSLYPSPSTIDYATRTAKILARRMSIPVYVGCSVEFEGTTVEEETEGLKKVIDSVIEKWNERREGQDG
ncbi:hypothetical protein FQN54_001117 [Arachnomyces sp. PD_36]|nr:hypothetical protein FQN54_001117 [Arachnomyces sp. PD_36]